MAATLLAGAGLSTWQAVRATRAEREALAAQQQEAQLRQQADQDRERAEEQEALARLNEYVADINLAQQSLAAGNYGRAVQLLDKHRPQPGEPDLRGFEWRYLWQLCQGDETRRAARPGWRGAGAGVFPERRMRWRWACARRSTSGTLTPRRSSPRVPKGAIVSGLPPGRPDAGHRQPGAACASGDTTDWTERTVAARELRPHRPVPRRHASGHDARTLCGPREACEVWDTSTWKVVRALSGASGPMAFSPDGKTLAADTEAGVTLWPLEGAGAGRVLPELHQPLPARRPVAAADRTLAFSPDGRSVVAARNTLSERASSC